MGELRLRLASGGGKCEVVVVVVLLVAEKGLVLAKGLTVWNTLMLSINIFCNCSGVGGGRGVIPRLLK